MKHFTIEKARAADCGAIEELEKLSFEHCWLATDFESLIERGGLILWEKGHGFIALELPQGEAEILRIAVSPLHRRAGLASELLTESLHILKQEGRETVFLEVSSANKAAISFYQKNGFQKTGLRKKYYRDGTDAVLMQRKILDLSEKSRTKADE